MTIEDVISQKIDEFELNGKTAEIWIVKGKLQIRCLGVIHNIPLSSVTPQPCEDAISRQAVLDINEHHHGQMPNHVNHEIWNEINALLTVTPKEKTGKWIEIKSSKGTTIALRCSCCGNSPKRGISSDYCPNCGAKMQEVSE